MKLEKLKHDGKVEGGVLKIKDRAAFAAQIARAFDGRAVEIIVQRRKRRRSNAQNAYWWGVAIPILGNLITEYNPDMVITKELVHEWAKAKWLPVILGTEEMTIETPAGPEPVAWTTTVLTTTQFMDLITLAQNWVAEFGGYLPDPGELESKEVNIDAY